MSQTCHVCEISEDTDRLLFYCLNCKYSYHPSCNKPALSKPPHWICWLCFNSARQMRYDDTALAVARKDSDHDKLVSWRKEVLMAPDLTTSSRTSSVHESRLVSPVTRPGPSSSNGVNSAVGRTCQYGGCPSITLSGGQYCMRHKRSDSPVRSMAATKSALHRPLHDAASKPPVQFAPPRKINGHPKQTISEEKSGDAITVNTTTQPVRPANSKKQLAGKVARKSTGPARFDPRPAHSPGIHQTFPPKITPNHTSSTNGTFCDSRLRKKPRLSPVSGDGISGLNLAQIEHQKTNGADGDEFSLRPKTSADSKLSKAGHPVTARKGTNPQKQTTGEKPSGRGERLTDPNTKDIHHILGNGDNGSRAAELQRPHAHAHEDKYARRPKDSPVRSQQTRDHREVQLIPKQTSPRHNKEQAVSKEKPDHNHQKSDLPREPSNYSRGPRPPESDHGRRESHERKSEPPRPMNIPIEEAQAPSNNIDRSSLHSRGEIACEGSIYSYETSFHITWDPDGDGIHTEARFTLLPSPTPPDSRGEMSIERPNSPQVVSGSADSDAPPISTPRQKPPTSSGLSNSAKSKGAKGSPGRHSSRQDAPVCSGAPEVPRDSGFVALSTTITADDSRKRGGKILNPEERRRILVEQHDPGKFDSYIYGKANEPFRPGSELFNVPWYEQPARPVRPATSFGYLDPRVHWSEPKPPQWFERKRKEVSERGGRRANFGRAAASAARRKLEDRRANRWVGLPERVKNNSKWLAALDEMDELADANRLRSLGLLGPGTTTNSGRNNHKSKIRRRRKREKRREEQGQQPGQYQEQGHGQEQEQETVEAPPAPPSVEQQQEEEEEERVQADAEAEEHESYSRARLPQSWRRKKGKARATVIIDDEDDWAAGDGDDEYMEMDSD